jgi:hypothetical protein
MATKPKYDAKKAAARQPAAAGGRGRRLLGEEPRAEREAAHRREPAQRVPDPHARRSLGWRDRLRRVRQPGGEAQGAAVRRRESGPWGDVDDLRTALWLSQHYRFNADKKLVIHAVMAAAHERRFHPVREYFAKLKWDGSGRASRPGSPSIAARARSTRARRQEVPDRRGGARDAAGLQDGQRPHPRGRAGALEVDRARHARRRLVRRHAVRDRRQGCLPADARQPDLRARRARRLLAHGVEPAKAFFSSRYDTFVPKYVAWAIKVPRQCVFSGTVNHGTYLRDTTGNRRYWPVKIERADIDELARDRDQLWAEAMHAVQRGRALVGERNRSASSSTLEQELRYVGDAYEDEIRELGARQERDHDGQRAGRCACTSRSRSGRVPSRRESARCWRPSAT